MRLPSGPNPWIALLSTLLILGVSASQQGVVRVGQAEPPAPETASIHQRLVNLTFAPGAAPPSPLDVRAFRLVVNDGAPTTAVALVDTIDSEGLLQLLFPEGAGSADSARLLLAGAGAALGLDVLTPAGALPTDRFGGAVAQAGRFAYLFGGASFPEGFPTPGAAFRSWVALDTILRIDLDSGEVRTMDARLPDPVFAPAAVFDPRASPECPEGCAYLFGGRDENGFAFDTITRYDPVRDATTPAGLLPEVIDDAAAFFATDAAFLLGGHPDQLRVFRFDPADGSVASFESGGLAGGRGARAAFDPRPTPACPSGCAYVFGGYDGRRDLGGAAPLPVPTTWLAQKSTILRFDPTTSTLAALPVQWSAPSEGPSVVWDGARFLVAGGGSCGPAACTTFDTVSTFDPATLAIATLPERLPLPLAYAAPAYHEGELVLLDGAIGTQEPLPYVDTSGFLDRLVRYRP